LDARLGKASRWRLHRMGAWTHDFGRVMMA
jgi:hypothetical protein